MHFLPDSIGWAATVVLCVSYFVKTGRLRAVQAASAVLWMAYGIAIHSAPVIVANLIVGGLAAYTARRETRA
jgi:uncharacterized protein with PQ loop repeat